MTNRRIAIAIFASIALTPALVRAECLGSTTSSQKRRAAGVFEATVASITPLERGEFAATLDVHRVWKGDVSSTTTVYFFSPSLDGPFVQDGNRYIFFVEPLNPAARKMYGLPADHPQRRNWVPPCGGSVPPVESVVRQLGQTRKVK
jgi:hypothetical protein